MEPLFEKPTPSEPPKKYDLPKKSETPSVGKSLTEGLLGRSSPKAPKEVKANPKEDESIFNRGRASRKDFMKALQVYDPHIDLDKAERKLAAEKLRGSISRTILEKDVKHHIEKLKREKNPEDAKKIREEIKLSKKGEKL